VVWLNGKSGRRCSTELAAGRACAPARRVRTPGQFARPPGHADGGRPAWPARRHDRWRPAETTLVAAAQAALQAENLQPWRQTLIHHAMDSNASGMICGGQQTVVVGFWQPGQALPATGDPWSIIGDGWIYHHTPAQNSPPA
jgi:hypothetical protein